MRTLQDIFYAVIDGGFYDPDHTHIVGGQDAPAEEPDLRISSLMCQALWLAAEEEVITAEEKAKAEESIETYLAGWSKHLATPVRVLRWAVPAFKADKGHSPDQLLAIYSNWAARPYPSQYPTTTKAKGTK